MKTDNQEIKLLVNNVALVAQDIFKNRCIAIYLMGSLARGGFSEVASDIDIGIILDSPLQEDDQSNIDKSRSIARNKSPEIKNSVSIFWGSLDSINGIIDAGRYPPFDRLDLIDHALLLTGTDIRSELIKPDKKELEISGAEFALNSLGYKERIKEFFDCARITQKGTVYVTKTILFPARFIYLERIGEIAGNEISCQYYIDNFSGDDAKLVRYGYQWRLHSLPEDSSLVTEQLNKGLIELYHNFIEIYIERMRLYGERSLTTNLIQWRKDIRPSLKTPQNALHPLR